MLTWWKRRTALKQAREVVKNTRKLLRMHRDIIAPVDVAVVSVATDNLAVAVKAQNADVLESLTGKLDEKLGKAFPRQSWAALRENVEVFLVAAIVAMGVRTFFIQPFKIPTGSMQPTLYGIYPYRDEQRMEPPLPYLDGQPSLPERLFGMAVQGKIYEANGYRSRGDHIFVDRFTYHFRKPQRGEVIVFDTTEIERLPESSRGKFYIKRLIGLGGGPIQIQQPYVLVNDKKLDSRPAFERIYSRTDGYNGYVLVPGAEFLHNAGNIFQVPPRDLFVLGDNSRSSLDGRFWGSLPERALIGRAIFVYWPVTKRFGLVD